MAKHSPQSSAEEPNTKLVPGAASFSNTLTTHHGEPQPTAHQEKTSSSNEIHTNAITPTHYDNTHPRPPQEKTHQQDTTSEHAKRSLVLVGWFQWPADSGLLEECLAHSIIKFEQTHTNNQRYYNITGTACTPANTTSNNSRLANQQTYKLTNKLT